MSEAEKIKVAFDADALAPLALFMADQNEIRYYLNGIHVMPHPSQEGVIIAATNGHVLALWYDKDGVADEARTFTITTGLISAAKKKYAAEALGLTRNIVFMGGRLCLVGTSNSDCNKGDYVPVQEYFVQAGNPLIDCKCPDISRVVPKNHNLLPGVPGHVLAKYVGLMPKAAALIAPRAYAMLRYYYNAGEDNAPSRSPEMQAVVALLDGYPHFMVVLMPCKGSEAKISPLDSAFVFGTK